MSSARGETVRAFADRLLAGAGFGEPAARILLLAYPRIFGYVFNPISVYFAYDANGRLIALIYAVRNTFGERHSYVAPLEPANSPRPASGRAHQDLPCLAVHRHGRRAIISACCRPARSCGSGSRDRTGRAAARRDLRRRGKDAG